MLAPRRHRQQDLHTLRRWVRRGHVRVVAVEHFGDEPTPVLSFRPQHVDPFYSDGFLPHGLHGLAVENLLVDLHCLEVQHIFAPGMLHLGTVELLTVDHVVVLAMAHVVDARVVLQLLP